MRLIIPERARKVAEFPGAWTLYRLPDDGYTFLWQRFRLMLPPDTPKRNGINRAFDLRWNPAECRFAKHSESKALETQQPDLAAQVQLCLELSYGPDWLESEDGGAYTPAEIQAERARLEEERAQRRVERRQRGRP